MKTAQDKHNILLLNLSFEWPYPLCSAVPYISYEYDFLGPLCIQLNWIKLYLHLTGVWSDNLRINFFYCSNSKIRFFTFVVIQFFSGVIYVIKINNLFLFFFSLSLSLPIEQLINLAHSVVASNTNLQQIAKLLHNLFTVIL